LDTRKFKLRLNFSGSIRDSLTRRYSSKKGESCMKYLDYTIDQLKTHLESLFSSEENLDKDGKVWMNWENHGRYNKYTWNDDDPSTWKWQIDHIKPQADFNFTSMENPEFKECWALSNLRPLSAKQNIREGSKRIRHKK